MAQCIARVNRPALVMAHNKTLAAQLYQEFRRFFPENAVEYFVSYYDYYQPEAYVPDHRFVYREGSDDQRRDRPHAALRHEVALRAARRHHRRQRLVHLRSGIAGGLLRHDAAARARPAHRPRADPPQARRNPIRAERRRLQPRRLPRARRHRRGVPVVRGSGNPGRPFRRRSRRARDVRSADGQAAAAARQDCHLSEDPLRHVARSDEAGRREHQGGARMVPRPARIGRQGPGGASAAPAHDVRPRDDQGDRVLPRHRELFPAPDRTPAGRAAADAARLPASRRA